LRASPSLAAQAYERWREVSRKQAGQSLATFDHALERLLGEVRKDLPFSAGKQSRSPLEDILVLRSIRNEMLIEGEAHVG
jgi:hypothetical protein